MTTAGTPTYSIAELAPKADRRVVLELWRRNLPGADVRRFEWLYEQGRAQGFLVHADGNCVGATGVLRRTLRLNGVDAVVGQAIDLNVASEHRAVGPALKLQRAVAHTVSAGDNRLLYAFPNAKSLPVLSRVGYRPLGMFQRWVKLLRSEVRLQRHLRFKPLTKAVAGLLDYGLSWTGGERQAGHANQRFEVVNSFDERFDELWELTRDQYPVIGERSADYLNWRFAQAPGVRHHALVMTDDCDGLGGYIVYCHVDGHVQINDLLTLHPCYLEPLLGELIRRMRSLRTESIVLHVLGPAHVDEVLRGVGFWRRPSTWPVMLYKGTAPHSENETLFDPSTWWLTRADVDTDL